MKRMLDTNQLVAYDSEKTTLVITLSSKTAKQMTEDGWAVGHDNEIGYFVTVSLKESDEAAE